jgi:hypothetical protein
MDAVRLGRALGFGARHAVKTLTTAVDAATAENPSRNRAASAGGPAAVPSQASRPRTSVPSSPTVTKAVRTAAQTIAKGQKTKRGLHDGTKRFGEAVWGPFVRLSGVLGLEVSGVFFGIFALFGLASVWRLRSAWHPGSAGQKQLLGAIAMLVVFGYFCVSSFVRARRRERSR